MPVVVPFAVLGVRVVQAARGAFPSGCVVESESVVVPVQSVCGEPQVPRFVVVVRSMGAEPGAAAVVGS